jgi:hypothetical protein
MASTTSVNEAAGKVRSRRALLAGVVGGLGAWATTAVGRRVSPVEAAAGDPMRIGRQNNAGVANTSLETSSDSSAFVVRQNGGGTAIRAESPDGIAGRFVTEEGKHALHAKRTGSRDFSWFGLGAAFFAEGSSGAIAAIADTGSAIRAHADHSTAIVASSTRKRAIRASSDAKTAVEGRSLSGAGLYGASHFGDGVVGRHSSGPGWAGRFHGNVLIHGNCTLVERPSAPSAPVADQAQLFLRDNGSGKSELCVQFASGPVQVLATEP